MNVFIEPHERYEAVKAYRDWLSDEQVEEIEDAPDEALICLKRDGNETCVIVIEEG